MKLFGIPNGIRTYYLQLVNKKKNLDKNNNKKPKDFFFIIIIWSFCFSHFFPVFQHFTMQQVKYIDTYFVSLEELFIVLILRLLEIEKLCLLGKKFPYVMEK